MSVLGGLQYAKPSVVVGALRFSTSLAFGSACSNLYLRWTGALRMVPGRGMALCIKLSARNVKHDVFLTGLDW